MKTIMTFLTFLLLSGLGHCQIVGEFQARPEGHHHYQKLISDHEISSFLVYINHNSVCPDRFVTFRTYINGILINTYHLPTGQTGGYQFFAGHDDNLDIDIEMLQNGSRRTCRDPGRLNVQILRYPQQ